MDIIPAIPTREQVNIGGKTPTSCFVDIAAVIAALEKNADYWMYEVERLERCGINQQYYDALSEWDHAELAYRFAKENRTNHAILYMENFFKNGEDR